MVGDDPLRVRRPVCVHPRHEPHPEDDLDQFRGWAGRTVPDDDRVPGAVGDHLSRPGKRGRGHEVGERVEVVVPRELDGSLVQSPPDPREPVSLDRGDGEIDDHEQRGQEDQSLCEAPRARQAVHRDRVHDTTAVILTRTVPRRKLRAAQNALAALAIAAFAASATAACGGSGDRISIAKLNDELERVVFQVKLGQGFDYEVHVACASSGALTFTCRVDATTPGRPVNSWDEIVTCVPPRHADVPRCTTASGYALQ